MPRGGKREGSGRKKGTPNKVTAKVKESIIAAFDELGGKDYLIGIARENPQVFCMLLGKVLPLTLAGDPDNPVVTKDVTHVDRPDRETREDFIARRRAELGNPLH